MEKETKVRVYLRRHVKDLEKHFKTASDFLVRCQIAEPYVQKGILRGSVCPWEIGVSDTFGFTILEDFHDTLEAIWVWSYYTKVSEDFSYKPNIKMAWKYVTGNFDRFIPPNSKDEGLYDCSLAVLSGSLYEKVFADKSYHKWLETAGNRLARYLQKIRSTRGREYSDPWWMITCLASAARDLGNHEWLKVATNLVRLNIIGKEKAFSNVKKEPCHKGPGGHDFFSHNANKVLALLSCFPSESIAKETIIRKFLPLAPKQFVKRHADENPWNINVAAAFGKSYLRTRKKEFLHRYFTIMDELKNRDDQDLSALSRSEGFPVRESWVTFFYAYAYASVIM